MRGLKANRFRSCGERARELPQSIFFRVLVRPRELAPRELRNGSGGDNKDSKLGRKIGFENSSDS